MNIDFKFLVKLTKKYCGLNPLNKTRKREFVEARSIMYMILRKVHGCTYTNIANMFKRNHATILHSIESFDYIYKTDVKFREKYDSILSAYVKLVLNDAEIDSVYAEVEMLKREIDRYRDKLIRIDEFNDMINELPKHKIDDIKKKLDIMIQVAKKDIQPRNQQAEIIQANVIAGV